MRGKGKDTVSAAKQTGKRDAAKTGAAQTPRRRQDVLTDKTVRKNTRNEPSAWGPVPGDDR